MGRLGVMVQLSFKVFPRPRATTTLTFDFGSLDGGLAILPRLVRGSAELEALDLEQDGRVMVRFADTADQFKARDAVNAKFADQYITALSIASRPFDPLFVTSSM